MTSSRLPRRTFLKLAAAGSVLVVPVALAAGQLRGLVTSGTQMDLRAATAATFKPHIGSRFHSSEAEAVLRLDSVDSSGPLVFALTFTGPFEKPLAQGTYVLKHDKLGTFPLFIVPHGNYTYEAVFNHQAAV